MLRLTELEEDALREFFNMGLGMAAHALSRMVGREILLSLPRLAIVTHGEALELMGSEPQDSMVAVRQNFQGELNGVALLIFPGGKSLELVRELLHDDTPLETLTELEQETLLDVGNIILNAFLASFTQMLSFDFDFEQAEFLRLGAGDLLSVETHQLLHPPPGAVHAMEEQAIFLIMNFHTSEDQREDSSLRGYVVLLFSATAMGVLKRELQRILAQY